MIHDILFRPDSFMVPKLLPNQSIFMHSEYKKDHTYLLAFNTTVLFSLNYLKFANKNKIFPFRNFHWLAKITCILDGGVYLERLNEYLIFQHLFRLSKIEI